MTITTMSLIALFFVVCRLPRLTVANDFVGRFGYDDDVEEEEGNNNFAAAGWIQLLVVLVGFLLLLVLVAKLRIKEMQSKQTPVQPIPRRRPALKQRPPRPIIPWSPELKQRPPRPSLRFGRPPRAIRGGVSIGQIKCGMFENMGWMAPDLDTVIENESIVEEMRIETGSRIYKWEDPNNKLCDLEIANCCEESETFQGYGNEYLSLSSQSVSESTETMSNITSGGTEGV